MARLAVHRGQDSPHTKHGLGVLPDPLQVHGCSWGRGEGREKAEQCQPCALTSAPRNQPSSQPLLQHPWRTQNLPSLLHRPTIPPAQDPPSLLHNPGRHGDAELLELSPPVPVSPAWGVC